jgi:hypothetical protein
MEALLRRELGSRRGSRGSYRSWDTSVLNRNRNKGSKQRITNLLDPTLKGFTKGIG